MEPKPDVSGALSPALSDKAAIANVWLAGSARYLLGIAIAVICFIPVFAADGAESLGRGV